MQRRDLLLTMSLGLTGLLQQTVDADLAGTNLSGLILNSDLIVIAAVVEIVEDQGVTVARAVPKRALKGMLPKHLFFVAEATWACDSSRAELGETVLLFLEKADSQWIGFKMNRRPPAMLKSRPLFRICHAGIGRMVIETVHGKVGVTASTYGLDLPLRLPRLKRTSSDADSSLRTVPLTAMEKMILREVEGQKRSARK